MDRYVWTRANANVQKAYTDYVQYFGSNAMQTRTFAVQTNILKWPFSY